MGKYLFYKAFLVIWGLALMAFSLIALFGIDVEGALLNFALGAVCGSTLVLGFQFFLCGVK